jgi:mono/diheme cytochrome c family protein
MRRLLLLALFLGAGALPVAAQQDPKVQRGKTFAQTNCASCHAVGPVGDSPLPEAPPFRTLHERYPVESLSEALAEGIVTGHPTMPEFRLDPDQITDLISYLKSLEPSQGQPSGPSRRRSDLGTGAKVSF